MSFATKAVALSVATKVLAVSVATKAYRRTAYGFLAFFFAWLLDLIGAVNSHKLQLATNSCCRW